MQKFIRFVAKASKFPSLYLEGGDSAVPKNPRKVILIEDFPNLTSFDTRQQYHACLREYLSSNAATVPLVFVVSDGARPSPFFFACLFANTLNVTLCS